MLWFVWMMALLLVILWRRQRWTLSNGSSAKAGFTTAKIVTILLTNISGDNVSPIETSAPHRTSIQIRRRFQFSSALKRMSTICSLPNAKPFVAVKGAPETIKEMLHNVPDYYDQTYKQYTRRGSRVLALGYREMEPMSGDKVG